MYKLHTSCRACGYAAPGPGGIKSSPTDQLIKVFDLGLQPLANDFIPAADERSGFAPLEVLLCPNCSLAQLSVVVRPDILYSHYRYVTSPSQTMQDHFQELTEALRQEMPFQSVLEIGSNDGTYLRWLRDNLDLNHALGIDPAENLVREAIQQYTPTLCGCFNPQLAEKARHSCPEGFDLIVARHVFCHVDDWKEFIASLMIPSHQNTLVAIEVPYVGDMLERGEFDTIYHEHLSYLSLKAIHALLEESPWRLRAVRHFRVHGGAIVLFLRRMDCPTESDHAIPSDDFKVESWMEFQKQAAQNMGDLRARVTQLRTQGKRVAGMGASAKSTVWVNACRFTRADLEFITDTTKEKLYTTSPGSNIPIVDEGAILRELPDYLVIFCWNYRHEVIRKLSLARERGVGLIFPVPECEVVEAPQCEAGVTGMYD